MSVDIVQWRELEEKVDFKNLVAKRFGFVFIIVFMGLVDSHGAGRNFILLEINIAKVEVLVFKTSPRHHIFMLSHLGSSKEICKCYKPNKI